MNENDKPRPVSGEIMTGGQPLRAPPSRAAYSDAEFETVEPLRESPLPRHAESAAASGMDFLREAAPTQTKADNHGGALFWATSLTLVILAFWISGGHALVRQAVISHDAELIQTLRIADVSSRVERHNGRDVLFVDGSAENHDSRTRILPGIEIVVFATDGTSTRYFLGTNATELKPGERYSFSSRLEAPTNGVKTVAVTFQENAR